MAKASESCVREDWDLPLPVRSEVTYGKKTVHARYPIEDSSSLPFQHYPIELFKDHVMFKANMEKYKQNTSLRLKLLSTGQRQLVEYTSKDKYWGHNGRSGKNKLGDMLKYIREILSSGQVYKKQV
jgi:hypothetical protein